MNVKMFYIALQVSKFCSFLFLQFFCLCYSKWIFPNDLSSSSLTFILRTIKGLKLHPSCKLVKKLALWLLEEDMIKNLLRSTASSMGVMFVTLSLALHLPGWPLARVARWRGPGWYCTALVVSLLRNLSLENPNHL